MATHRDLVEGLRAVAELIESKPELPAPASVMTIDGQLQVGWHALHGENPARQVAVLARLIGGRWDKNAPTTNYGETYYELSRRFGPHVKLTITAFRNAVCERVVTGQREVTKEVPTATETVTVTEDVYEWRCHPLLVEDREPESVRA